MKMERQRSRKAELDSLHVSTFDLFDDATQIPIRKDFQKTRTLGVKPFPEALLPSAYTRKHRPFSSEAPPTCATANVLAIPLGVPFPIFKGLLLRERRIQPENTGGTLFAILTEHTPRGKTEHGVD